MRTEQEGKNAVVGTGARVALPVFFLLGGPEVRIWERMRCSKKPLNTDVKIGISISGRKVHRLFGLISNNLQKMSLISLPISCLEINH